MTIVALDACGRYAIAALRRGAETLYASSVGGEGAVRAVYSSLDKALEQGGIAPANLAAIVVNTGPGSWTGVRVAVTYTAALAFTASAPVFGYSGFDIGRCISDGVGFIDQLGKLVAEAETPALTIQLFPELSAETYLAQRRSWLDAMLDLGAEALTSGASGDPIELRTTYFQEFLAGGRT
jgi:tRNA threonylcarbamoyl adenosine modification protein YeaZ